MSAERAPRRAEEEQPAAALAEREFSVAAVTNETAPDWQEFVAAAQRAELYHDYRWRQIVENVFGHECHYLLARDAAQRVCGVVPLVRLRSLLFGDYLVSLPYFNYGGILAASSNAARALAAAVADVGRALGVAHAELRHRSDDVPDWPKREDKVAMLLELPSDGEVLFKSLPSKLRAQVRRPQKVGASCRSGGTELLDGFFAVFARNMRDLGTPVYPRKFFARILESFREESRILVVHLGGKPVAAGLLLRHRRTMEIPWASSLREANRDSVNMLLYWSALEHAMATGCRWFDFGRSSKDSGTYRFKQQWGARPQQLRWHYWLAHGGELPQLSPANPKYRLAINAWKRLPLPVANWLGPHIVRNLP